MHTTVFSTSLTLGAASIQSHHPRPILPLLASCPHPPCVHAGVACPLNVTMRSRGVYEVRSNLDVEVFTQKYFRPNLCAVVIVNRTGSGRTIFDLGAWIINSNRSLDCPQAADLADPTAAGLDFVSVNTFNPATCAASSAPALGLASGQWWLTLGMAAVATLLSWTWAA